MQHAREPVTVKELVAASLSHGPGRELRFTEDDFLQFCTIGIGCVTMDSRHATPCQCIEEERRAVHAAVRAPKMPWPRFHFTRHGDPARIHDFAGDVLLLVH